MDQARRAARESLASTEARQLRFREASLYSDVLAHICRALHVKAGQVYLLHSVPEQYGEEHLTLFVWPISIVTCEIDGSGSLLGGIAVEHLHEYARGRRGGSRRTLEETLKIAARSWPA